jgi:hypothetical protein
MKAKQPDMNEMLNAYMDGELETRQTVEFKRLLENSPELLEELGRLERVRNLVHHLPLEESPIEFSQQVRSMLERKALFGDEGQSNTRFGTVFYQKIRAVAAVLALGSVLGWLVYSIVAPVDSGTSDVVANSNGAFLAPIQGPMRGKLELVCAALPPVDDFLMRSVQFNDLSSCVQKEELVGQKLYHISCHREDIKHLLSDLNSVWHQFEKTAFYVNTDELGEMIRIDDASVSQIASLINEQDALKRLEHARLESVRNSMANSLDSGRRIASSEDDATPPSMPPRPMFTSGEPNRTLTDKSPDPADRVELTIVLRQSPM